MALPGPLRARRWTVPGRRAARILLSLLSGLAVAAVVHALLNTTGLRFLLLAGAVIGLVVGLVSEVYARTLRVAEVTLSVPQLSQITFVVTDDSRRVAWHLFVETATRVAVQRLDAQAGFLREALTSLYTLFQATRDILKASQPSRPSSGHSVEYLAIMMLNREIRPFLSRWHPRLTAFERESPGASEVDWPDNAACRADLAEVQDRLKGYAANFAVLANVADADALLNVDGG